MSRNYLRRCTVTLSGSSSISIPGGGPTDLRVEFTLGASSIQSPNPGRVRVTNPSPATVAGLKNKEFQTLTIKAGYEDNVGLIYSGDVKQSLYAHAENVVDSYVDVFCAEHANAYQQSHVNRTLAAGWTARDKLQLALDQMKPFGITGLGLCNIDLDSVKRPRGRPVVAMARDVIREIASSAGATWSMHNGQVHIIDPNKPVQTDGPVVLNSKTGLVGFCQQTENGIIARCLINPAISVNTTVQIDESSIIGAERNNTPTGESTTSNLNLDNTGRIAADGMYRVAYWEVEADTRGQSWYQTLTLLATGASLNDGQLQAGLAQGFY